MGFKAVFMAGSIEFEHLAANKNVKNICHRPDMLEVNLCLAVCCWKDKKLSNFVHFFALQYLYCRGLS